MDFPTKTSPQRQKSFIMELRDSFEYEIVQNIAILSTDKSGWTKELDLVSYNGAPPKYDIRSWDSNHEKMRMGVTLNKEELVQFESVLRELL